jgi:hypothetical protein
MPLSRQLLHVDLTLECKHCGRSIIKKGSWFAVVHRFKCEGCNREVSITYSDKIALFNKYARPITAQAEIKPTRTSAAVPLRKS